MGIIVNPSSSERPHYIKYKYDRRSHVELWSVNQMQHWGYVFANTLFLSRLLLLLLFRLLLQFCQPHPPSTNHYVYSSVQLLIWEWALLILLGRWMDNNKCLILGAIECLQEIAFNHWIMSPYSLLRAGALPCCLVDSAAHKVALWSW